ncbi:MAG TPA: glycosyltransferase [Lacunisphaera sp.]|jgi:hypothetical protein|nr:glycosyltransferase [Lacunisphaera sp.]
MTAAATHLVLLPAYNPGPRLVAVVTEVLRHWQPVLVVIDGSTDGSERPVLDLARDQPALTVLVLSRNAGKGAAVLAGAELARSRGFSHGLVMDADGQHPAASIGEFMAASMRSPRALVLGRPIFPPNIPAERLHGRKLSTGLVRLEVLGHRIADPLFGFRVYPLGPLLAVLGSRRGGRRYDFDTEAAVRLAWAGVPLRTIAAPVRYFSRAEGGVSHFHYLRDNATLVWLHVRLLTELLFWRWPALLRHRRPGLVAAVLLLLLAVGGTRGGGDETDPLVAPSHRLGPAAPGWRDLVGAFAHNTDVAATFTERRYFPFKSAPVELAGVVRVSPTHGLSLHYAAPANLTVILDAEGMLRRSAAGERSPPADPRAAGATAALRHIVRLDLAALEPDFELYGEREGATWSLALVPRSESLRRSVGRITVSGAAATIRRVEIRRTPQQSVEILIDPPEPPAVFTREELRRYFR